MLQLMQYFEITYDSWYYPLLVLQTVQQKPFSFSNLPLTIYFN